MTKIKAEIVKITKSDSDTYLLIKLPNPHKGLFYISVTDPDSEAKMKKDDEILEARKKAQRFYVGDVEISQD